MKRRFLVVTAVLWAFWIALADQFELLHALSGLLGAGLISLFSFSIIEEWLLPIKWSYKIPWRLGLFLIGRLKYIIHANIDLAERLLDPQLPINPAIIRLKHNLKNPVARTILANTITLTPGTLTVEIDEKDIYVHFLAEEYLDNILSSNLTQQIKHVLLLDEEKNEPQRAQRNTRK